MNVLNAIGSEQKDRRKREKNVVLFGVPTSLAATEDERVKEDEATTLAILEEIGVHKDESKTAIK